MYLEKICSEKEATFVTLLLPTICISLQTLAARETLATVYTKLGDHKSSIALLEKVVDESKSIYGFPHTALAVPLARLTAAYYHDGNFEKSREMVTELRTLQQLIPLAGTLEYGRDIYS